MCFFRRLFSHSVFKNASALTIMQLANYIVPLLLLPFLTRVLGMEAFGMVAITLAMAQFAFVLTDYGFSLSATYEISINRDDSGYINKKLSSIFGVKLVLVLLSCLIVLTLPFIIKSYAPYSNFFAIIMIAIFAQAFQPLWLFQGIEKMKNITIYSVLTKIVYALLVVFFVRTPSDAYLVILFWGIAQILGTACALFFIYKEGYKILIPKYLDMISEVRDGAQFFWSRLAVSTYTSLSTVFLGIAGPLHSAIYAASEQIYKAGQNVTGPINAAMFPYMVKNKDWKFFYKIFFTSLTVLIVGCSIVGIYSKELLSIIFGEEYASANDVLRVFLICVVLNYVSVTFGYSVFGTLGRIDIANKTVILGAIVHVLFLSFLNWYSVTALTVAIAVCTTELVVCLLRFLCFIHIKNNLRVINNV